MLPADNLGARDRRLRPSQGRFGAAVSDDVPPNVVSDAISCPGQRIADDPQSVERDISSNEVGTRLLEHFDELAVGTDDRRTPVHTDVWHKVPRRRDHRGLRRRKRMLWIKSIEP